MFKRFSELEIEEMLKAMQDRLSAEEFAHVLGVGETATQLAQIYASDLELAFVAGILHDWDKETPATELLEKAETYGMAIDEYYREAPKLLHEKTGARGAREYFLYESPEAFDIGDRVVEAISRHTLAAPDMSELDMIIYIADLIEPHRDYAGVEDLREMVGTVSLEMLFIQALERTINSLVARRLKIHPTTIAVWNHYCHKGD